MNWSSMVNAAAVALVLAFPSQAQEIGDPDYQNGYGAWKGALYPDATELLRRFRAKPYGERFEVDYWIGTGWCRMPGDELVGWDLLDWAMYAYPLSPDTRTTFKAERDLCQQIAIAAANRSAKPRTVVVKATGTGATARAEQTKLFYIPGGDRGVLRTYPPKTKREIPVEEFNGRLIPLAEVDRAVASARALAPEAKVGNYGGFILASTSGHSSIELEKIGARLNSYLAFLSDEYGMQPPTYFITVYMVPNPPAIRVFAERLHGLDVSEATLGYAFQNDLSVLAQLRGTGVGTLLHEVFHLAVRSTYGAVPQWLDEGMASLYETCTMVDKRFLGEPNWRAIVLNELGTGSYKRVRLEDVVRSRWFWDDPNAPPNPDDKHWNLEDQAYMMALARYFSLYLQEEGKLTAVFDAYRNRKPAKEFTPAQVQAVTLVETSVGKPLGRIEADFWKWYPKVRDPSTRLYAGRAVEKELPRELPKSVDRDKTQ